MATAVFISLAFLAGLTLCGLAGSVMELAAARRLAFAAPFVSSKHMLRSLAATACAGPFMLMNEALEAHRQGYISFLALLSCLCTVAIWVLALGVVVVAVAGRAVLLLAMPI